MTGQNGTGKTRLLCALSAAFGNTLDLDARFQATETSDIFVAAQFKARKICYIRFQNRAMDVDTNEDRAWLQKMFENGPVYHQIEVHGAVNGLRFEDDHIRFLAHVRPSLLSYSPPDTPFSVQAYRGTSRITDQKIAAFQNVQFGDSRAHVGFERPTSDDGLVCQTVANQKLSAALEKQDNIPENERRYSRIVESLEATVSSLTGREFAFKPKLQPEPHLLVSWGDDIMKLQELPDGLRVIIGWLVACISKLDVQFYSQPNPLEVPLILLLDEPETHLHPAWQRQIIPAAQKLFPNAQIFVATHSPFVISSVNSGWIHVLRPNEKGIVTADEPRPCSKGDSWIDAVEDVLGVTEWYDPETEALLTEFRTLKRKTLSERGDLNSLKEKAEAIASRSESLRSMMAREMHQLQRNMAEAVAEP